MKTRILASLIACLFSLPSFAHETLHLVPAPKKLTHHANFFRIKPGTAIASAGRFAKEDRIAAEMLAEEIKLATGAKKAPRIGAVGTIVLKRLAAKDFPKLEGADAERFKQEGYVLDVTPTTVTVAGASAAGLFYGVQTLRQLIIPEADGTGAFAHAVHIEDWPTMQWRGLHDDISRGPVPTMEYMKKQIRTISEYKLNMFSLYMEHTFAFKKFPAASPLEGAVTADDVKELVEYAKKYHITLLPEQQAFGHLHHVVKAEKYSDLAENPHGHVLSPANPKTYEFIKDMYAELVPLFPGELFHIGADETWELGTNQTKQRVAEVGLGRVYLEHITKVSEILRPYNKRLLFWADIAESYPDLLTILPKDSIAVAWSYGPSANFDNKLKPFADKGLTLMVAPGANNWNRIVPNYGAAFINIRNFVRDGQKYKAIGMLNTTWDDNGEALFEMNWPQVVFGAACSWQSGESSIEQFQKDYDWAFYRNASGNQFQNAILKLTSTHDLLQKARLNGAYDDGFWVDPFTQPGSNYVARALPVVRDVRLAAEDALESLIQNRDKAKLHTETLDSLIFGAQRVDALGLKIQFADETMKYYRTAYDNQNTDTRLASRSLGEIDGINARLQSLRDEVMRIRALYVERWNAENKPYWLGSVTVRYDVLGQAFQRKINEIKSVRLLLRDKKLPAPETLGFFNPDPIPPPPAQQPAAQPQQQQPATTPPPPPRP